MNHTVVNASNDADILGENPTAVAEVRIAPPHAGLVDALDELNRYIGGVRPDLVFALQTDGGCPLAFAVKDRENGHTVHRLMVEEALQIARYLQQDRRVHLRGFA